MNISSHGINYINANVDPENINYGDYIIEIFDMYYLKDKQLGSRWMLFIDNNKLNNSWKQVKKLYIDNELKGVFYIGCTPLSSFLLRNKEYGIISLCCERSYDNLVKIYNNGVLDYNFEYFVNNVDDNDDNDDNDDEYYNDDLIPER